MSRKTSRYRMAWTAEEDAILRDNLYRISRDTHKGLLKGRSATAIRWRMMKLGLHIQARNMGEMCYAPKEVAAIMGTSVFSIYYWIGKGMLAYEYKPTLTPMVSRDARPKPLLLIPWPAVDDFINEYPMLLPLVSFPETVPGGYNHRQTLIRANPDDWVTTTGAARMLNVCDSAICRMRKRGEIEGRLVLKTWYYRRSDISTLAARRRGRMAA